MEGKGRGQKHICRARPTTRTRETWLMEKDMYTGQLSRKGPTRQSGSKPLAVSPWRAWAAAQDLSASPLTAAPLRTQAKADGCLLGSLSHIESPTSWGNLKRKCVYEGNFYKEHKYIYDYKMKLFSWGQKSMYNCFHIKSCPDPHLWEWGLATTEAPEQSPGKKCDRAGAGGRGRGRTWAQQSPWGKRGASGQPHTSQSGAAYWPINRMHRDAYESPEAHTAARVSACDCTSLKRDILFTYS